MLLYKNKFPENYSNRTEGSTPENMSLMKGIAKERRRKVKTTIDDG